MNTGAPPGATTISDERPSLTEQMRAVHARRQDPEYRRAEAATDRERYRRLGIDYVLDENGMPAPYSQQKDLHRANRELIDEINGFYGIPTAKRTTVARTARRRGAGRPARRTATRSSARSGDSGDDGPGDSDPAPPAAREAVARVFEDILRRRHDGAVAWRVVA